jgi:hypothetical protein
VFDLAGETTQTTSQGTLVAGGNTVGVVNQRNFTYDQAGHLLTVTADARAIGGTDGGPVTLLSSPSYDAAGQLTAASLATDPSTQQSMIGLGRTYDSRLRPLSEVDAGQVVTGDAAASTVVTISGTEKNIGGSGTPSPATGTITFSHSGTQVMGVRPLFLSNLITLPGGYHSGFVTPTETAIGVATSLAAVLNEASPR